MGSTVVPGDRLGRLIVVSNSKNGPHDKFLLSAGPGTYIRGGYVHASVVGILHGVLVEDTATVTSSNSIQTSTSSLPQNNNLQKFLVTVKPSKGYFAYEDVINVGQIILGRVIRTQSSQQQAIVSIFAIQGVEDRLLRHHPEGVIRKEDVRTNASERSVQIQNSFRSGDIVLARVISLGDPRRYFLSTAELSLGVIHAISSVSKKSMIPTSWKEMECPETGEKELRKCAKPPTNVLFSS